MNTKKIKMDNGIIGQEKLVKEINRVFEIFKHSNAEIRPHFILTGPSGSGKSFTIGTLAAGHEFGYVEINAAQLTKEGTSGNSLSKALTPVLQTPNQLTVVFVDEFDKLFISGNSNSSLAHETTTGVQNEFLKVLESNIMSVYGDYGKYVNVPATKCLFVFAGAFNNEENISLDRLREIGLKTEFLGRVPLVFNAQQLSIETLFAIVDNCDLLHKYCNLFDEDFEKVGYIIKSWVQQNFEMNTLGARLINSFVHQYFIKGGKTSDSVIKDSCFTKKLKL